MSLIENSGAHAAKSFAPCQVVVRNDQGLARIMQFVIEGLQIGQQVVAMAGPRFLRELAGDLGERGFRPEIMLRNGRLVFLTAPNCLSTLLKPDDPLQRTPLRPNAPLLRWVTDWSWAYGTSAEPISLPDHQGRVHEFIRSLGALSLCTVESAKLNRNAMLALLADHRRLTRGNDGQPGWGTVEWAERAGN